MKLCAVTGALTDSDAVTGTVTGTVTDSDALTGTVTDSDAVTVKRIEPRSRCSLLIN